MAHKIYIGGVLQKGVEERIVDQTNDNNFGVLFHDTKAIEDFQSRSGMEGRYSVEYQHHYINLVGRIEADGQRLDIAIPMAMYNYHQEVAGASVEFSLQEVSEANNLAMPLAVAKVEEIEKTAFFKALTDFGIVEWQLVGLNSVHAHPASVNGFSGTDLRADINHPGVNFPLSVGENIPNFASIIQHKANFAEIIHTEYRLFNGEEGGIRHYQHGRCLTLNRGYSAEAAEPWEEIPEGPIDSIFGTSRPQRAKPAAPKNRENFVLKDRFADADVGKMTSFTEEMMKLWSECPFEIDISSVLKTNVLRGRGRLQSKGFSHGGNQGYYGQGKYQGVNQNAKKQGNRKHYSVKTDGDDLSDIPTYKEMRQYLLDIGLESKDIPTPWTEVKALFVSAVEMEEEAEGKTGEKEPVVAWEKNTQYSFGTIVFYQKEFYEMKNQSSIISYTSPDIAIGLWKEVEIVKEVREPTADEAIEALKDVEQQPSHWKMCEFLKAAGYEPEELAVPTSLIADMYWIERLDEVEDERAGIEYEPTLNGRDDETIFVEGGLIVSDYNYTEQCNMLAADNIKTVRELKEMTVIDVKSLFTEIYVLGGSTEDVTEMIEVKEPEVIYNWTVGVKYDGGDKIDYNGKIYQLDPKVDHLVANVVPDIAIAVWFPVK